LFKKQPYRKYLLIVIYITSCERLLLCARLFKNSKHVKDLMVYSYANFIEKEFILQSFPFKNAVDVASNGERFTLANAANLKN
jgi:hypothetical protein